MTSGWARAQAARGDSPLIVLSPASSRLGVTSRTSERTRPRRRRLSSPQTRLGWAGQMKRAQRVVRETPLLDDPRGHEGLRVTDELAVVANAAAHGHIELAGGAIEQLGLRDQVPRALNPPGRTCSSDDAPAASSRGHLGVNPERSASPSAGKADTGSTSRLRRVGDLAAPADTVHASPDAARRTSAELSARPVVDQRPRADSRR
jgi:hypothetical protein